MAKINHENWEDYVRGEIGEIKGSKNADAIDLTKAASTEEKELPTLWNIQGLNENDIIHAANGVNFISGDAAWSFSSNLRVSETEYKKSTGDDIIVGGTGVNFIHGGLQNDEITGGAGINVIQFKTGDGNDTIYNSAGSDFLYFCDSSYDDLKFSRIDDNLIITYGEGRYEGTVTLKDYYKYGAKSSIKGICFSDEKDNSTKYKIISKPLARFEERAQNESVTVEEAAYAVGEAFKNAGSLSEILSRPMNFDIEMKSPGAMTGSNNNDNIKGSSGEDIINAGGGDDTIEAGRGDDVLYGGTGKNTFIFNIGDGKDTIYYQNGTDILDLTKVTTEDAGTLVYPDSTIPGYKDKNDLVIKYTKDDEIRLVNYFRTKGKSDIKVKVLEGGKTVTKDLTEVISIEADYSNETRGKSVTGSFLNDSIKGTSLNDTIRGGEGNDILTGGKGNDRLYGEAGKNTLVFSIGDGADTVYSGKGEDTIKFTDIETFKTGDTKNIKFSAKGNDLIINYGNGDTISVSGYLRNPALSSVKFIQFKDSEPVEISKLLAENPFEFDGILDKRNTIRGTNTTDIITGGNLADNLNGMNGNDIIYAGAGNDIVRGGNDDDIIYGEAGDDRLYGDNGNDTIYGGDGNDIIYGGNGDDIIYGNSGNDKLYGDAGNNSFHFKTGDGNDIVYSGRGNDSLHFDDANLNDLTFSLGKSNALTINYSNSDSVDIATYFSRRGNVSTKTIVTKDGEKSLNDIVNSENFKVLINGIQDKRNSLRGTYKNDVIKGGSLADTITGADGNDTVYAGAGNDNVRGGNGDDVLYGEAGDDRLYGDNGNDIIYGGDGNDIIYGGNGDDIIYGNPGNDKLYGDAGRNVFYFKEGDGADTIYMNTRGDDTIVFDKALKDTLTFDKSGNNLVINYGSKGDNITIINYLRTNNPALKNIIFADYDKPELNFADNGISLTGDIITQKDIRKFTLANGRTANMDYFKGNEFNNLIVSTNNYATVEAGGGDDTMYLQSREAKAYGGDGNDKYIVTSLRNNTYIEDNSGNDTVKILDSYKNMKVLFNVAIDAAGNTINTDSDYDSLCILNNATFNRIKSTGKLDVTSGVEIANFTKSGDSKTSIQRIETNNGYMDSAQLDALKNEVAGWLIQSEKYTSAMDVLDGGNKADINSLLTVYQNADWKQPGI